MTTTDFFKILRTIVEAWPYSESGRLNTLSLFDTKADLDTPNLSMGYRDYEGGFFWSRAWVNQGAIPGNIRKEYGILAVEIKTANLTDLDCKETTVPVYLNVLNQEDCLPSRYEVDELNQKTMVAVLGQLKDFARYTVNYTAGGSVEMWLHPDQYTSLSGDASVDTIVQGPSLYSHIPGIGKSEIYKSFFGVDGIRSVTVKLDVQLKVESLGALAYGKIDETKLWG